mgnify:FL=1
MVKHIILWKLKEELTSPQKKQIKAEAKQALEGLNGVVPGLISLTLHTGGLPSSNADMMLESVFENEEALKGYQSHPAHLNAANGYVRPYTAQRLCLDFEC